MQQLQVGARWPPPHLLFSLGCWMANWMFTLTSATVPCVATETETQDCPPRGQSCSLLNTKKKITLLDFYLHKLITKLFLTANQATQPICLSPWLPRG